MPKRGAVSRQVFGLSAERLVKEELGSIIPAAKFIEFLDKNREALEKEVAEKEAAKQEKDEKVIVAKAAQDPPSLDIKAAELSDQDFHEVLGLLKDQQEMLKEQQEMLKRQQSMTDAMLARRYID